MTKSKKKLAFVCAKGLESFIEPVVREFEKIEQYQTRRYYIQTQAEIVGAIKWGDIVFLEWANESAIMATQVFDIRKRGVIVRLHSYEALSNMPQQIDWRVVDYLVFVASHIREIVKRHIPDIDKRVCTKIIPNGLDIDRIPVNKTLDPHNIAYVCNINHKKEPALALQILAELVGRDPKYRLHVAGSFQDERFEIYLKYIAVEMGIAENIVYYGFIQDMNTFWEGKGILLSTSIHEGHPMNIMEGAARGLRPVVHNFYGAKNLYPDGWLFNTVGQAVKKIERHYVDKIVPRKYIVDMDWTLASQVQKIKALIDKAGRKK